MLLFLKHFFVFPWALPEHCCVALLGFAMELEYPSSLWLLFFLSGPGPVAGLLLPFHVLFFPSLLSLVVSWPGWPVGCSLWRSLGRSWPPPWLCRWYCPPFASVLAEALRWPSPRLVSWSLSLRAHLHTCYKTCGFFPTQVAEPTLRILAGPQNFITIGLYLLKPSLRKKNFAKLRWKNAQPF